jgi:hypothetical protein
MKNISLIVHVLKDDGSWEQELSTSESKFPGHAARLIIDTTVLKELSPHSRKHLQIEDIELHFNVHSDKVIAMMFTHKGMCLKTGAELINNSIRFGKEHLQFCNIKSRYDDFAMDIIYTPNSMTRY